MKVPAGKGPLCGLCSGEVRASDDFDRHEDREIGSVVKPTAWPRGVSAIAMATPRAARDVAVSARSGRLLHVQPQVLMTKMTRIWVDIEFDEPGGAERVRFGVKDRQENRECQQIKCRRHVPMTNVNRRISQVPRTRTPEVFAVDVIERNADFGRVVEQVVQQDLHRQER